MRPRALALLTAAVLSLALSGSALAATAPAGATGPLPPAADVTSGAAGPGPDAWPEPFDPELGGDRPLPPAEVVTGPVGEAPERATARQHAGAAAAGTDETTTPRHVDRARERIDGFATSTRTMKPIPVGWRPYQDGRVRPVPFGRVDAEGVRMFRLDRDPTIWNHPVAQAQYGLYALESYRLTGQEHYLDVALANADRIVSGRHEIDGAWYFPYDFDFDLYRNGRGVLQAPWTSGMSSGQALSLFVKLHEVTGEEEWRTAADATFAAFTQAPDGEGYFSAFVDDRGMLWLEEYSRYPEMSSERVLNGHMWSMFGLWEYWNLHGGDHPEAERLFRGALHTIEKTGTSFFRQPGWQSRYSVWQGRDAPTYHQHHQDQFLQIQRMTHDSVWLSRAFTYRQDYPEWRSTSGFAVVTPKMRTVYRLDDEAPHIKDQTMAVLDTRSVRFTRVTGAGYDKRGRIPGGPNVIRLSTGPWAGWWMVEQHGVAWSRRPVESHSYLPRAELTVGAARSVAVYAFDAAGNRTGHRFVTLEPGVVYEASSSVVVEGRVSWRLEAPGMAGYWLPHQSGLTVLREPGWG